MKRISLLTTILLLLVAIFAFSLAACNKKVGTLESLENEYGIVVDGGGFEEGSTLVSNEIATTAKEAEEILTAIADQDYNKDGNVYIFDIYVTKDGVKVQPNGKVKVSIPVPGAQVDNYLVFHMKADNSIENLVPTVADGKISFETSSFSYFVIAEAALAHEHNYESAVTPPTCTGDGYTTYTCACGDSYVGDTVTAPGHTYVDGKCECGADDPNYAPPHVHSYAWVEGKASTCKEEGIAPHYHCEGCGKNFDENKSEIASVALPLGSHEYGSMYWGKSANFWEDGNIEYYQCETCEKYFDTDYNEIASPVIPKYATNLSICVNGTSTALVIGEQHESFIEWSLEGLSVTKGDVITICQTDNKEVVHKYFADGNVGTDGKILTTAAAANVLLTATPNGLMLFIDGYKYEGIVIEINGVQYPMNFVTYPDGEETSYVYGYVEFAVDDKFVIVDNVSGTVYDHDDLAEELRWDTWDFHRGDNGEFVIDFAARYGIEFDNSGNKKIYITKAFTPYDGESFGVIFESEREDEMLDSIELPTGGADNEFMWTLTHCTTMNNSDFVEYIDENGLWFYLTTIDIEAGEKFSLKNFTTGEFIGADYLVDITGDITAVTRDGDLVSVEKSGSFYIIYLPAFNSFTIDCDTSDPLETIYLFIDSDTIELTPDENGDVTYDGFEMTSSSFIMFMNARYDYLEIVLDETMDETLTNIVVNSGVYVLYPTKPGVYNIRYNVNTTAVYLEFVRDIEGGEEEDTITYFYWLGTESDEILMEQDATNESIYMASGVTMNANGYLIVGVYDSLGNGTICTALAETDSSIAQSDDERVTVYLAGTYTVYFDITARTIKLVRTGDLPEQSATVPKDIYIRYDNILTLIENPDNPDELCYLGFEMGAFEPFKFRDTDRNYITDIKLAEGTTGASTNGTEIAFQVDGTFNIYIHKTTHVVRIVSTSSGGEDIGGGDVDYSEGVYLFLDDFILLYPDEDGNVTYNGFAVDGETSIAILDKSYNYLPLTLDASVSASVAQIYSGNMLFFYKNGTANMTYNVNTGVIFVEMASTSLAGAKVYLFYSGNNTNTTADENGKVTFENIVFTERGTIMLTDSAFEYLSMTLDPAMDASLGSVADYGGIPTLIVNSAGTYNIHYDLATGVILLEVVDETEPDAHEHAYESVVTPPTCTKDGYTTYTCECGDSYVDDTVTAMGHAYSDGSCSTCGGADPDYVPDLEPTPDGTVIELVEIFGIKTPLAGEHPVTDGVYALQEGVEIVSVDWGYEDYDSTGEYTTFWLTASDVFDEEMGYYLVKIRIRALDGYYFNYSPDDEYYDMWTTLNGGSDTFQKDLTDDPYHVVDVYANLIMNTQTINVVEVYDLDRPVPSETPDYEATLAGEGYTISGIYWYEYVYDDEGSYVESVLMDGDDVFEEGHYYDVEIVFVVDEGREFATYEKYLTVQVRINGEGVDVSFVDESDIAKGICGTAGYDCYSEE